MKCFCACLVYALFLGMTGVAMAEGASLEVRSARLADEMGLDLEDALIRPGTEIFLEVEYARKGFPPQSQTTLQIQLFDANGRVLLDDHLERPFLEGGRMDRYAVLVPPDASGHYLVVLTLSVVQGDRTFAEVTKTIPFEVGE